MFWCQLIATIVAGTVQLGVQAWMFTNINDMCSPNQLHGFSCPSTQVFGTASIIWGLIGPARQFSHGQIYYGLLFFFIIGLITPIVTVSGLVSYATVMACSFARVTVAAAEEIPQYRAEIY